jgi:hypothetical protein
MTEPATKQEPTTPPPTNQTTYETVQNALISDLKKWPNLVINLLKKPYETSASLPTKGSWLTPLIYACTAGLISGIAMAFWFTGLPVGFLVSSIIRLVVGTVVGCAIGGVILNVLCSIVKKDPGIYRSILVVSTMSILSAIGSIVAVFTSPIVAMLISAVGLYVLYFYVQATAEFSKKQAGILVGVLVGLMLLSWGGLHWSRGLMGPRGF